mgnify:CR=1 FL=1
MAKKRVLGVVGMGHVGAHVAYALAIQGIADELVLVDQNEQKLASEVQDLRDAVAYMPHRVTVRGGDFSDLGVCDVIVNSVTIGTYSAAQSGSTPASGASGSDSAA